MRYNYSYTLQTGRRSLIERRPRRRVNSISYSTPAFSNCTIKSQGKQWQTAVAAAGEQKSLAKSKAIQKRDERQRERGERRQKKENAGARNRRTRDSRCSLSLYFASRRSYARLSFLTQDSCRAREREREREIRAVSVSFRFSGASSRALFWLRSSLLSIPPFVVFLNGLDFFRALLFSARGVYFFFRLFGAYLFNRWSSPLVILSLWTTVYQSDIINWLFFYEIL